MQLNQYEEVSPWWNIILTASGDGYSDAKRVLKRYGSVESTHFFNVLVGRVASINDFLHDFSLDYKTKVFIQDAISRIRPLMHTFTFSFQSDFENKVMELVEPWIDIMANKTFHVRIHRRGKKEFSGLLEEQFLDRYILSSLQSKGSEAKISFDNPDFIIDLETLDQEAGLSIWTKEDLRNYPFLKLN